MTRTGCVMQLDRIGAALRYVARPVPEPGPGELRVRVLACGVCRTDLHMIDGEVPANLPIVPGHEIVGRVEALGEGEGHYGRRPYRHSLARRDLRRLSLLPLRPGESLRPPRIYRRGARRRLRHARGRRCTLPSGDSFRPGRDRGRAAALCRTDRLPVVDNGGGGQADRALWLRRIGAHHCAGRTLARARTLRLHPSR